MASQKREQAPALQGTQEKGRRTPATKRAGKCGLALRYLRQPKSGPSPQNTADTNDVPSPHLSG
jgi:hypothetical protein